MLYDILERNNFDFYQIDIEFYDYALCCKIVQEKKSCADFISSFIDFIYENKKQILESCFIMLCEVCKKF